MVFTVVMSWNKYIVFKEWYYNCRKAMAEGVVHDVGCVHRS